MFKRHFFNLLSKHDTNNEYEIKQKSMVNDHENTPSKSSSPQYEVEARKRWL